MTAPLSHHLCQLQLRDAAINEACAPNRAAYQERQRIINRLERWAFLVFVPLCAVIGVVAA